MIAELLHPLNPSASASANSFNLFQTSNGLIYNVGRYDVCTVQYTTDEAQAVLTLYRSNDGKTETALETAQTLGPSNDMSDTIDCSGFLYLHVVLTTLAAAAAFGTITVVGKHSGV